MNECAQENVLQELLELLKLEKIEENIFRGQSQDLGFGAVFGGQVLGQALSAASQTVPPERRVHSLHGYFLRPGDPTRPFVYNVDCIRDGSSFTTRRVVAIQKGRAAFNLSVSFQKSESGFEHQDDLPEVPGPEGIASERELLMTVIDRISEPIRSRLLCRKPIEFRPVNPMDPFAPQKQPPVRNIWFRAVGRLPDDPAVHQYMLAYASDFGLVITSLYPHGHGFWEREMQVASLDHALWFYRDFRMDDWLLYCMESPRAAQARGLVFGRIYSRDGALVAVVAQEGLIRYHGGK